MSRNIKFTIPIRDDEERDDDSAPLPPRERIRRTPRSVYGGAAGIRLGLLCLLLVMVIMAMNQAAKPASWNWLFQFDKVDLPADAAADEPAAEPDLPAKIDAGDVHGETKNTPEDVRLERASAPQLERHFWKQLLEQMDGQQQVRLFNLVEAVAKQNGLPAGSTAATRPVITRIKSFRQKFAARTDPSRSLNEFQQTWTGSLLPAFEAIVGDEPDPALVDDRVRQLVPALKQASAELIKDKTPVGRVKEAYAWFSAWSEVFDQPMEQDINQSATVTQLLSQPEAWRGQTLRVDGTALRVERVEASHNALGIQRYYVIWIKPNDPSIYPYCVYTLMAPESLMGEPDEKMREVDQRVTTTARFFKNRLFNASANRGDEAAYAPVLLTAAVEIPEAAAAESRSKFKLPDLNVVLLSLGLIGGLAALIAMTVYRSTLGGGARTLPRSENLQQDFTRLREDDRVETTIEKLQRMSQQSQDGPADQA